MRRVNDSIVVFEEQGKMAVRAAGGTAASLCMLPYEGALPTADASTILLPWTDEACRLVSNCGVNAIFASPFWWRRHPEVEGRYKPLAHQLVTAAYVAMHPRCYVLSDCRLGKTGSVILGLHYLQETGQLRGGVLVITTVTTMRNVWEHSIRSTLSGDGVAVVYGKDKDVKLASPSEWYITNYDTVRLHYNKFVAAVDAGRIAAIVVDELTHVGNSTSKRHKAISALCNSSKIQYVVGMTGSPGANPEPVYGMAKTINPAKLPVRTKTGWRDLTTFSYGSQPFMRKPVAGVGQIIRETLTPAIRFRKEDVLDLPPIVYQDRQCALSSEQRRMVEEFRADAVAFAQSGEVITAANGAVKLSKLLQTALGFCINENGDVVDIDHDDRTLTIKECVAETERKVVIFSMFKHRLKQLCEELQTAGYNTAYIDGDVTGDARSRILSDFQEKATPHILCCHPITVGFGTELSAADTMIFDGPPVLGGFVYMQALERLSSTKQQADKISVIKIMASAEERAMFQRLDAGQSVGQAVAALFEDYRKGEKFMD